MLALAMELSAQEALQSKDQQRREEDELRLVLEMSKVETESKPSCVCGSVYGGVGQCAR
jgi:hypothetical protein